MDFYTIVKFGRIFGIASAVLFALLKYVKIQAYRVQRNENIPIRLFSSFHQIEVYGTDSPARRRFLLQCNRLTFCLWLSIAFLLSAVALPYIKHVLFD
jgi:hypothetical protein